MKLGSDYSWEVLKFKNRGSSDYRWEVLEFTQLGSQIKRKCWFLTILKKRWSKDEAK